MNRILLTYRKLRKKIRGKNFLKSKTEHLSNLIKVYSDLRISENSKQDEHTLTHIHT